LSVEIITIGSELTSGDVVDANGPFLAKRLLDTGLAVERITSVGDNEQAIEDAVRKGLSDPAVKLIIATGGLGPTADDITSRAAAKTTGRRLVVSDEIMANIHRFLKERGKK